ncbi:MAG TPA: hypothetical protein VNN62_04750 [Methylomirabilota bacterium]|jgi:hypothetical protein|nr:hypothetical protein [Methylomirabilota bacterium]
MRKAARHWVVGGLVTAALLSPSLARADYLEDAGMGTATVLANVLYMPAKLVYATLGGITGGFAYVLTGANYQVAERVWIPSLGGNYVLNPEQLRGNQPIYFSAPATP